MQNSQSFNPTVAKLLEADAHLAATKVDLNAQIQSIREKRHSLKTVINVFAPVDLTDTSVATSAQLEAASAQQVESTPPLQSPVEDVTGLELNGANADTTEAEASVAPTPQKQKAKNNSSSASNKQSKKSAPTEKQSKAPDTWHQYVKDNLSNVTLAEAVSEVMQQHQKDVLEIATIINAIAILSQL